jgi:hypothetical protein
MQNTLLVDRQRQDITSAEAAEVLMAASEFLMQIE